MSHMRHVPQSYQDLMSNLVPGTDCGYGVYAKLREAYSQLCIAAYDHDQGLVLAPELELARIRFRNVALIHHRGAEDVL
jgi:hypothetical protein